MALNSQKNQKNGKTPAVDPHNLSEIVHDLNNVLYALSGFVEIAIDDLPAGHPAREALIEATRAGDGAAALVSKLIPAEAKKPATRATKANVVMRPKVVSARRVLVIEEEPMVAELLERALCRFGFEAKVFTEAEQAWQVFTMAPDEFDAIVTDEATPTAVGLEVVMRMQGMRPQMPIILMTAGGESMMTSRALEAGIQHVMHKPIKIQELCRTLEELTLTLVA